LLCGLPWVGIPLVDECEQAVANLSYRHTESYADGAAVLVPVAGWSGGDNSGCFEQSLSWWQVFHPLIHQSFGQRLGACQRVGEPVGPAMASSSAGSVPSGSRA
jgi:hypothetical protein